MNILRLIGSLATAILLFSNTPLFAQCPTGNITLGSQASINFYVANYGSCTNLPGDLIIGSTVPLLLLSDITDISGLANITSIGGDLIIQSNPMLTNLAGLDNLTFVNRDFTISENAGLTTINNLNNLTVNSSLTISDNDILTSITGLSNYTPGVSFSLTDNPLLSSIPNFSFTTPAAVIVTGNTALTACVVPGFCQAINSGQSNIFASNGTLCSTELDVEIACSLSSLPVELVYFEAAKNGRSAELSWVTSSESNNQGFIVQHSIDGQRWNTIDFVAGQGTTVQTSTYNLLHTKVSPNQNYYRLKQLDFDGTTSFSEIRRLDFKFDNIKDQVQVYPNPTSSSFRIVVSTEEGVRSNMKLSDVQGRIIWEKNLDGTEGSDTFFEDFDLPAPQLYFLHVQNGSNFEVQRIQVLEN